LRTTRRAQPRKDPEEPVYLSEATPSLDVLLQILRRRPPRSRRTRPRPDLPAAAWKRLFLIALKKVEARGDRALARFLACAALDLHSFTMTRTYQLAQLKRGFTDLKRMVRRLQALEDRQISGKSDLKPRPWPPPIYVHLMYRQAWGLFAEAGSEARFEKAWNGWIREGWAKRKWAPEYLRRCYDVKAKQKEAEALGRALYLVAAAVGKEPASVKTMFNRAHLPTSPGKAAERDYETFMKAIATKK